MVVAVGMTGMVGTVGDTEGITSPTCGLGISTKAQLDGVGVADPVYLDVQLEKISAHNVRTKVR